MKYFKLALVTLALLAPSLTVSESAEVRVSGTWRTVDEIHARVSGTWREVEEGWVRSGGVWRQFYTSELTLNLNNHTVSTITSGTGVVTVTFGNDGILDLIGDSTVNDIDEWTSDQPASTSKAGEYEVAYTQLVSGDGPTSGASIGSYQALSSSRTWSMSTTLGLSGVWRFRVREIANTSNFVEGDFTMSITIVPPGP